MWLLPRPTNDSGNKPWSCQNPIPVPIEDVMIGDRIVGFAANGNRQFQTPSQVLARRDFAERGCVVTTKRGYSTVATHDHPLWCCPPKPPVEFNRCVDPDHKQAQWRLAGDVPVGWYVRIGLGPYRLGNIETDDDAYFHGLMDGDGSVGYDYGVMKYASHEDEQDLRSFVSRYLRSRGVDGAIKEYRKKDSRGVSLEWCHKGFKESYNAWSPENTASVLKGYIQGLMDAEGCFSLEGKVIIEMVDISLIKRIQQWLLLFGVKSSLRVKPPNPSNRKMSTSARLQISGASVTMFCSQIGFRSSSKQKRAEDYGKATKIQGRCFWDRIVDVSLTGEKVAFVGLTTEHNTYLSDGFYSHNSGKSVAVAMEFASRILGIPITGPDGKPIPLRYPVSTPDSPRQYWIIGWDTTHAATIHRLLFQRGMGGTLRAIRDQKTEEWRLWNRSNPADVERFSESVLTEPIIPSRFYKGDEKSSFSWQEQKSYQFHSVELSNGAIIYFWPSSSKSPKQGEAVSGIWIDEDIQASDHLKEWQDRLTDMRGWFMWSVWPHVENDALIRLQDRAIHDSDLDEPQIEFFQLIMSQNPFLDDASKAEALGRMETEEEIARRDRGEMLLDSILMYDFNRRNHVLTLLEDGEKAPDDPSPRFAIRKMLTKHNGRMPKECTRYLSIDPSNTRTAVQGWAIPPKEFEGAYLGDVAVCEWELIVRKYSAAMLAKAILPLVSGYFYEAFIMDQQIGRQTNVGRDETVFEAYAKEFKLQGLLSRQTHNYFLPGCNVPSTRQRAVREMLAIQETGLPMLMFVDNKTPQTQAEFGRYRKKVMKNKQGDTVLDQPDRPQAFDAMAALEYFAGYAQMAFQLGYAYQSPEVYGARKSPLVKKAHEMMRKHKAREEEFVHLGPGSGIV